MKRTASRSALQLRENKVIPAVLDGLGLVVDVHDVVIHCLRLVVPLVDREHEQGEDLQRNLLVRWSPAPFLVVAGPAGIAHNVRERAVGTRWDPAAGRRFGRLLGRSVERPRSPPSDPAAPPAPRRSSVCCTCCSEFVVSPGPRVHAQVAQRRGQHPLGPAQPQRFGPGHPKQVGLGSPCRCCITRSPLGSRLVAWVIFRRWPAHPRGSLIMASTPNGCLPSLGCATS